MNYRSSLFDILSVRVKNDQMRISAIQDGGWIGHLGLRLGEVPMNDELLIELISDKAPGDRRLGVMVRGIRLSRSARDFEGVTLGADYRRGFEESGFHLPEQIEGVPGRWTDGAATLRVLLDRLKLPKQLELETMADGEAPPGPAAQDRLPPPATRSRDAVCSRRRQRMSRISASAGTLAR